MGGRVSPPFHMLSGGEREVQTLTLLANLLMKGEMILTVLKTGSREIWRTPFTASVSFSSHLTVLACAQQLNLERILFDSNPGWDVG